MDALIQLNANVPAHVLFPYVEKRPVHAFVLLSRATDREGVLLELLPRLSGARWFAGANMLFEDRSPGLLASLIRSVRLQLTVHVADSENVGFLVEDSASVSIACGVGQDPPAYPPHAEYRFGLDPQPGLTVLAPGPHPVYYTRIVTTSSQYGVSEATTSGPTGEDRVKYLRTMSPDSGGIPFRAHTIETVPWSTAAALSQRDRARQFHSIPGELVVEPPIELHLVDQRRSKDVPLPTIDR